MDHVRRRFGPGRRRVRDLSPHAWTAVWDWRTHRRRDVFPVALGVLLLYHVGTLALYRVPLWGAFCAWFLGLPLS